MTRDDERRRALSEANRRSWNEATRAHQARKADQARFLAEGGTTLFPEEIELLGDLSGRRLVHLLCNAGQDSLSLAARGARVTGVDISDTAIEQARALSRQSGIRARFERAEVIDWLESRAVAANAYDIAFCSYGVLIWIFDLERFARGVARILAPGGRFVCVEFHPLAYAFDESWRLAYDISSGGEPVEEPAGVSDYVAASDGALAPSGFLPPSEAFRNPHPSYEVHRGLGEIVSAFAGAGLIVETLREYPWLNGCRFGERMRPAPGRRWLPPEEMPALLLMFGLSARRGD